METKAEERQVDNVIKLAPTVQLCHIIVIVTFLHYLPGMLS